MAEQRATIRRMGCRAYARDRTYVYEMSGWKEAGPDDAPLGLSGRGRLAPIPQWQRDAIDLVVHDMWVGREASLCFAYAPEGMPGVLGLRRDAAPIFWAWVEGEDGASGTAFEPEASPAERLVRLADWLQDQVISESDAAWAEAIPPCPGHPHPATPELVDDEAWWVCPSGDGRIARIGQLSGS